MVERLALGIVPGAGWRASEIRSVAQEAEAAGFAAIFSAEVNNDVLATAQLMGEATKTIQVGSWIANIYLRHSYTCARGAALIALEALGGPEIEAAYVPLGETFKPDPGRHEIYMKALERQRRLYDAVLGGA